MSQAGAIAIQYGEVDETEDILELVLLNDLVEELRDMCRRIGERAAAQGGEDEGIMEVGLTYSQDGANLVQGDLRLFREHQAILSDTRTSEGSHGNDRDVVRDVLQL